MQDIHVLSAENWIKLNIASNTRSHTATTYKIHLI